MSYNMHFYKDEIDMKCFYYFNIKYFKMSNKIAFFKIFFCGQFQSMEVLCQFEAKQNFEIS